jgi:ABC-type Fe3+-siderophore transport system permease subunit
MSDDFSVFHRQMRKPAVIAISSGAILGVMSVTVRRQLYDADTSWIWAVLFGGLAAIMLYARMYYTLSQRHGDQD